MKNPIIVSATINAPVTKAWETYNFPEHVIHWSFASDDWECPTATSDLRVGGIFSSRMQAKDGSFGFDFGGTYTLIETNKQIHYTMNTDDGFEKDMGRKVEIYFKPFDEVTTEIIIHFEPEQENPIELQAQGWQAILNNYKKYTESLT